ncbi:hypothetical protein HDU78_003407 [Chytriomyces hyalinus]|nr:hypothetical protein HDU78_003407 [Chytriomyces hyalinus]
MNQVFFVQYQTNQPVQIRTHQLITSTGLWVQTLFNVADIIDAAALNTTRRLIGLPEDFGPLTLHAVIDGVEGPALQVDLILSDLSTGRKPKNALVIKSKSDMDVNDSHVSGVLPRKLKILATVQANETAMRIGSHAVVETQFANSDPMTPCPPMTAEGLWKWLHGSPTNSSEDIQDSKVVNQEEINEKYPIEFPLVGRDESLAHIASCFVRTYEHRTSKDRNKRPIPMCTGVPGLGKTRLMEECSTTVLDMTGIPGERMSVIVSFGNDGNAYSWLDRRLGIQCSFAWRVLHLIFKAHFTYEEWMREKSPPNRSELTLRLVLSTIDHHWRQKATGKLLVFVGVDGYQKLGQANLSLLLDSLCDLSCVSESSPVTLFCMLAGAYLNMTRIAQMSHPSTERTPIRFLTHAEAMKAIGPYISKHHPGFVVSEAFAQNVYYLGGVPRLLTQFSTKVIHINRENLFENQLREARMAVLCNLQYPQLSVSDILKLLAMSFTNAPVNNVLACPFRESLFPSARSLNWSQMVSNGMCLIQEDGRLIVPFHLVPQVLARQGSEGEGLDEFELALLASLKDLSTNVEIPLPHVPAWLSWESFGAHFYCVRINSFLVLGYKEVRVSDILRGTQLKSAIFATLVHIRVAKVFHANEHYGPDIPQTITHHSAGYIAADWTDGACLQVVLNGDGGPGVDIFFALKREDDTGYIVVLDQRKRLGSQINLSGLSAYMSKIPDKPKFMNNVEFVVGLMNIYSPIKVDPIPNSMFFASTSESPYFHGSLFDHPGCSIAIDVNSGLKSSIQQLFLGTQQKRNDIAESIIEHRKKGRIDSLEQLMSVVAQFGGELDTLALARIKF